jgi:hypothetical protein
VTTQYYPNSQQPKALSSLETALEDPSKAVMVNILGPVDGYTGPYSHIVVVLGVDTVEDVVYLNDSAVADGGQNIQMSLDDFLTTWKTQRYVTITAQLGARPAQSASSTDQFALAA